MLKKFVWFIIDQVTEKYIPTDDCLLLEPKNIDMIFTLYCPSTLRGTVFVSSMETELDGTSHPEHHVCAARTPYVNPVIKSQNGN